MLVKLLKATVGMVVETPVAAVADILTLGGSLTDRSKTYTESAVEKVIKNIEESTK